jgi:hypothetical protein
MQTAVETLGIPEERVFTDLNACLSVGADLAILCVATAEHAAMTERIASSRAHLFVEKPFAASAADARRMMAAMAGTGKTMAINWPLRWVASHVTAKRLIEAGEIGELNEVHSYGGNRGPLYHLADKVEVSPEEVERQKPIPWWYRRQRVAAACSLWGDARHLVHGRRGAARGDVHDRRGPGHRDRPAFDHRLPLCARTLEDGDPPGHIHRPLDPSAAAEVRLRLRRHRRHDLELRLRGSRDGADSGPVAGDPRTRRAAPGGERSGIEYVPGRIAAGEAVEGPLNPELC